MAELNFGLLTPPGSQSIGNAFVSGMDQAAVARAQENQNALSQYTLGKARREDEQQNRLYQAIQDPNFKLDLRTAMQYGPQGMAALKAQTDAAAAEQERALKQSQITEREARLPGFIAEAYDKRIKPYSSAAYNSTNVEDAVASINGMYDDPPVAAILSRIKPREAAIQSTIDAFADPKTRDQWRQYWGGITPEKLFAQTTISAGEQARLDQSKFQFENPSAYQQQQLRQAQDHFNGLSAYQKEQLRVQGIQFDPTRGVLVNIKTGTYSPVDPAGGAAPVGAPAVPSVAPAVSGGVTAAAPAPSGGVPGQRQAPAGQPAGRLGPTPEKPDASYYKEAKGIINTNNALNNLKQGISNLTPSDMVNPSRRSEITQLSKTVALLSKEMFGLGVLNAGDLTILEQVIPNPVAFNQGLVPIETIKKNLIRASNTINQINNTLSRVHKQPLLSLDAETPNAPSPSAPPIESFRRP